MFGSETVDPMNRSSNDLSAALLDYLYNDHDKGKLHQTRQRHSNSDGHDRYYEGGVVIGDNDIDIDNGGGEAMMIKMMRCDGAAAGARSGNNSNTTTISNDNNNDSSSSSSIISSSNSNARVMLAIGVQIVEVVSGSIMKAI